MPQQRLQTEPPSVDLTSATLFALLAHLHSTRHVRLVVDPAALTPRLAADQRFVHLDRPLGTDAILVWPHHSGPQLVQQLKSRFVPAETELPLELERRHAGRLRRHEIRPPEPHLQRRSGRMHDGPRRQGCLLPAAPAAKYSRPGVDPLRLPLLSAVPAGEAIRPPDRLQVRRACRFSREHPLELQQRRREAERGLVHAGYYYQ